MTNAYLPLFTVDNATSETQRLSAMQLLLPWRGVAVIPTGADSAAERAAAGHLYAGIPGGAAGSTPMAAISLYYHLVGGAR